MKKLLTLVFLLLSSPALSKNLNYNLTPEKVADDIYVFIGSTEHFDRKNGGNIVNTGFIIAPNGVIVIDTGPSAHYGREMRQAIRQITPKPVTHVIITHHHPDHFLGNQSFDGAQILAMEETIKAIEVEGEGLLENMFRMVGDWMRDTQVVNASQPITVSKADLAGRRLQFIPLHGHTAGDLAVLDEKSGTLFAGDLAFHNRTATTPHADLDEWVNALEQLQSIKFTKLVPGHGPVEEDGRSLTQTKDYLLWLKATLVKAAADGLEMTEVMRLEKPERFKALSLDQVEFQRSVAHLWPETVEKSLTPLD